MSPIPELSRRIKGGSPATGAIARTATNISNGGISLLGGMVQAMTLVLIILFLALLAVRVPPAALAAILFMGAWNMKEIKHFVKLVKRTPPADTVILQVVLD